MPSNSESINSQTFSQRISNKINSLSDLQVRVILSKIFDEQKSVRSSDDLDKELVEIRDSWLVAADPETQLPKTMRVAYEYFANRGLEKYSLKSGSEFEEYMARFFTDYKTKSAKIMYTNHYCALMNL